LQWLLLCSFALQHGFAGGGFSPWIGILIMVPLANLLTVVVRRSSGMAELPASRRVTP